MKGIDFFNTMDYLDPRCTQCDTKLKLGETTEFSDEHQTQVCVKCGTIADKFSI